MSVELVTVKLGSDQERIRLGQLKEFSFGIDVECCADGRAQVRDPEVGTSVKRFVGFLNYHQLEGRVGFGRLPSCGISSAKVWSSRSSMRRRWLPKPNIIGDMGSSCVALNTFRLRLTGKCHPTGNNKKEAGGSTGTGLGCLSE